MTNCKDFYIDGRWISPSGNQVSTTKNPATEQNIAEIAMGTPEDVSKAVVAARRAFATFSLSSRQERIDLLSSIMGVFAKRYDDVADALTTELGAPTAFAKGLQVGSGMMHLQTAIEALRDYRFEQPASDRSHIIREPIGVVGMITPWNWPINQTICKVVPALAVGCTIVHKPSELSPLTARILTEIFHEAGVPAGVYNMVSGDGPVVGTAISSHPDIDMVSITGSTAAGVDVAKRAADSVKRVHQELGGKSPYIVLESADLGKAITANIYRLMLNTGQSCFAPSRLLVPAKLMEEAKAIAKAAAESVTVGDPTAGNYMGPLVSQRQWNRVQAYIEAGEKAGATLVTGGRGHPAGLDKGYYVKPTIFADVKNSMVIAREEIFGPVLSIIGYQDVEDAISIANDTDYGLAAYVLAATDAEAETVAARLRAGVVFINGAGEDAAAPVGGYKKSGNGREWGAFAFGDFLETKSIVHPQQAPVSG